MIVNNDTEMISDLLHKTGMSVQNLTNKDVENIHEQLLTLKQIKETNAEKAKKKQEIHDTLKDMFGTIFNIIYSLMMIFNICLVPMLIKEHKSSDLAIVLTEITIVGILAFHTYMKAKDNEYVNEELVDALNEKM